VATNTGKFGQVADGSQLETRGRRMRVTGDHKTGYETRMIAFGGKFPDNDPALPGPELVKLAQKARGQTMS
jgi:hypothetical protein